MKTEQTECSETSEYKIQMPGNYSEENVQHVNLFLNDRCTSKWLFHTTSAPRAETGHVSERVHSVIRRLVALGRFVEPCFRLLKLETL
jgi:hypothetical protein